MENAGSKGSRGIVTAKARSTVCKLPRQRRENPRNHRAEWLESVPRGSRKEPPAAPPMEHSSAGGTPRMATAGLCAWDEEEGVQHMATHGQRITPAESLRRGPNGQIRRARACTQGKDAAGDWRAGRRGVAPPRAEELRGRSATRQRAAKPHLKTPQEAGTPRRHPSLAMPGLRRRPLQKQ